jgi:hypothetical protein
MTDETRGVYRKYRVERLNDPTGKHDECAYFVLDITHDRHARNALCAYANSCRVEFPQLAADLHAMLSAEALAEREDTVKAALVRALETAINSVECDSIGADGEELPWYKQAKAALANAS